jgi:hypothetical protein
VLLNPQLVAAVNRQNERSNVRFLSAFEGLVRISFALPSKSYWDLACGQEVRERGKIDIMGFFSIKAKERRSEGAKA